MVKAGVIAALVAGVSTAGTAQAYRPSFQPARLTDRAPGPPNAVLVLGSPHLSGLPDSFRPAMVEPLLTRLIAWRPTAVASENISGLHCDAMRRQPHFADTVATYCFNPAEAGKATGLDVAAANAAVEQTLANWPKTPAAADRRRLAALFLAAGEPVSAAVQWLRLPSPERHAEAALTPALAAWLDGRIGRKNESYLVAAQLAARSGLERVWSVDDQSFAWEPSDADAAAYGAALARAWDNPGSAERRAADDALNARLGTPDGLLSIYRAYNTPSVAMQAYRADWGAALTEPSPQQFGRRYVAYWETRNLRMVANIREVLGRDPGTRLIAIVGASHKGYYEAYLNQMRDVTLVDAEPVLR